MKENVWNGSEKVDQSIGVYCNVLESSKSKYIWPILGKVTGSIHKHMYKGLPLAYLWGGGGQGGQSAPLTGSRGKKEKGERKEKEGKERKRKKEKGRKKGKKEKKRKKGKGKKKGKRREKEEKGKRKGKENNGEIKKKRPWPYAPGGGGAIDPRYFENVQFFS